MPIDLDQMRSMLEPFVRGDDARTRSSSERRMRDGRLIEYRDRLKSIAASMAGPEIGDAPLTRLDPVRRRDRRAALGTGVLPGDVSDVCCCQIGVCHGASPVCTALVLASGPRAKRWARCCE